MALLILLMCLAALVISADVTLVLDPNNESDLAGYKVHYGTASRVYGAPIVLGKQTTFSTIRWPYRQAG
jgi:hypothetical protein